MTPIEIAMAGGLAGTWCGAIVYARWNAKRIDKMQTDFDKARFLIVSEAERKDAHTKAFETLSDPDKIVEEMEKSARATEMRIARRTTLPREDAGPPAKVYRPRILKKYPRSWPR